MVINPMNRRYIQVAAACLVLSIVLSLMGATCLSLAIAKGVKNVKSAKSPVIKVFSPSIETITYAGRLIKVRSITGAWGVDTDKMAIPVITRPETCTPGDSVMIYEYGSDKPRDIRILPYQKLYRIKERSRRG